MENLIFLAAGFVSAGLLGVIAVTIAWLHAVKRTERRMSGQLPADGHSLSPAEMKASLQRQSDEIQRLSENETIFQENAKNHEAEIQSLANNLRELHTHYETARRDADEHRRRATELETVLQDELRRQEELEPRLRKLGEDATRLASQLRQNGSPAPQTRSRDTSTAQTTEPLPSTPRPQLKAISASANAQDNREERPLDERIRALQAGVAIN